MRTGLWTFTIITTAAAVAPSAAAQDADARSNLAAFKACAGIADDEDRHRCLDDALRTTGMIDEQAAEERARVDYGRSEAAIARERRQDEAHKRELAGGHAGQRGSVAGSGLAAQVAQAAPSSYDQARESLQTSIAAVRLIGNHTMQVTTGDAGTWISTERQRFRRRPAKGDAFEIIPAALGGYRCRLERSTVFACRRLD